jgi:hypothetical protein
MVMREQKTPVEPRIKAFEAIIRLRYLPFPEHLADFSARRAAAILLWIRG